MELLKVQALKAKEGKKQHMQAGLVYEVSEDHAKAMKTNGTAVGAKPNMKVGEVYDLPKGAGDLLGDK
jgi:hypothetical protein